MSVKVEDKKTEVDELRAVLELATEEELKQVTEILFSRSFNPLDYLYTPSPIEVQSQDWQKWLDAIERRFRFLAADGFTVLRRQTDKVRYRDVLIQVCRYLQIPYSQQMNTVDIEAEIFLHLLQKTWEKLPAKQQDSLKQKIVKSLTENPSPQPLPLSIQHDPLKILIRGGSVVVINSFLKNWLLGRIAQQFALHFATYQAAKNALLRGGIAAANQIQNYFTLQMAKRGMAMASARYTLTRSIFAFLGPALWVYFFADLGWRAIATNYTRIIPVIFTLAQIRLTRSPEFQIA